MHGQTSIAKAIYLPRKHSGQSLMTQHDPIQTKPHCISHHVRLRIQPHHEYIHVCTALVGYIITKKVTLYSTLLPSSRRQVLSDLVHPLGVLLYLSEDRGEDRRQVSGMSKSFHRLIVEAESSAVVATPVIVSSSAGVLQPVLIPLFRVGRRALHLGSRATGAGDNQQVRRPLPHKHRYVLTRLTGYFADDAVPNDRL